MLKVDFTLSKEGPYLDHGAITGCEYTVQGFDLLDGFLPVSLHFEPIHHLPSLLICDAFKDVDWNLDDLVWVFRCQILNASPT